MLDAQSYIAHVDDAGKRIARDAEGNLETTVPSCPEMTVAQLVTHTAAFCRWSGTIVSTGTMPASELGEVDDPIAAHREQHTFLVKALQDTDPDGKAWTWSTGEDRVRFWHRRAAQELAVHSWDVGNAAGKALPIDPTLAADGVDEMLRVFGAPNLAGYETVAKVFGQGERAMRLEATDIDKTWTFRQDGDVFDLGANDPTATARAPASDLLLFLWGRLTKDALAIEGDASLIDLWAEKVKI